MDVTDVNLTHDPTAAVLSDTKVEQRVPSKFPCWPTFEISWSSVTICQEFVNILKGPLHYFIVKVTIWSDAVWPIGAQGEGQGPIGEGDEAEPPEKGEQLFSSPSWGQSDNGLHEIGLILQGAMSTSSNIPNATFQSKRVLLQTCMSGDFFSPVLCKAWHTCITR